MTDARTFDPEAPLGGPPDPWAETDMPSPRNGPPWHMTEMIEAEPALAVRILDRLEQDGSAARLAAAVREHAGAGNPIAVVGCGTSEHGARAIAALLGEALGAEGRTRSIQAFEASADAGAADGPALVVGISHEGATWATMRALEVARAGGASTALVTVTGRAPAGKLADIVLETAELDRSWCHTVGYVSPIVAGVAVAAALRGAPADRGEVRGLLAAGLTDVALRATEAIARQLAGVDRVIVIGSGVDRIAARELTLKIEEGTHVPAAYRDVETLLHGHLAGVDERTGLIAIAADPNGIEARAGRIRGALLAARAIGVEAAAILSTAYGAAIPSPLTPAGRIEVVPSGSTLGRSGLALLATAVPLQALTERLARERRVNPDPIRRDDPRYLAASAASSPEG
jgi:glutamine---fructose-6-phosphate transaminase (isomerizing)